MGQEPEQLRQVGKVSDDHHIPRLVPEPIPHDDGRVGRLHIARRVEGAERVADAPEYLRRLTAAQLAAVPHDVGADSARSRFGSEPLDRRAAGVR